MHASTLELWFGFSFKCGRMELETVSGAIWLDVLPCELTVPCARTAWWSVRRHTTTTQSLNMSCGIVRYLWITRFCSTLVISAQIYWRLWRRSFSLKWRALAVESETRGTTAHSDTMWCVIMIACVYVCAVCMCVRVCVHAVCVVLSVHTGMVTLLP